VSTYSIKDLENLSGIKAHTIRMWEQRYNVPNPKRTSTNIRYYDDEALKLILNIALLNNNGYKISKIVEMSEEDRREKVSTIVDEEASYADQVYALTMAMVEMDEEKFEKMISISIIKFGFEKLMVEIIPPFLQKIGTLWQTGAINPAQEHFISNLIRQKLIVAIDGQNVSPEGRKFILFLPEGELHEISLLFANYILRSRGHIVIYLGQSLPFKDLEIVYDLHKPDYILAILTTSQSLNKVKSFVEKLTSSFKAKILMAGGQAVKHDLKTTDKITIFKNLQELIDFAENCE